MAKKQKKVKLMDNTDKFMKEMLSFKGLVDVYVVRPTKKRPKKKR